MNGRPSKRTKSLRRRIALATAAIMAGTLLSGIDGPAVAADAGRGRPELPASERALSGTVAKAKPRALPKGPRTPQQAPAASWPKAGAAVVTLTDAAPVKTRAADPVKAKGLPLSLDNRVKPGASAKGGDVTARVLSRKAALDAGVDGVLLSLQPDQTTKQSAASGPGSVRAQVDYSGFAGAYGGGYASRLTLIELPACALTTPKLAECRTGSPVVTVNDTEQQTLTATSVPLRTGAPTVLAAMASTEGGKGDYKASPLSPSAAWQTNLNTGDFSWSYPMTVPNVPGGLTPNLALSYSSAGVDGRTGSTNNQSSWVGDGFDLSPGFIERRYKPCAEDDVENAEGNKPGDLCWAYDNAFMTFNGKGGELVPAGTDTFKLRNDDGTVIKRVASASRGNGDDNGEHWILTDPLGVRYYFGYNRLPGWTDGKETTDSTFTVPVFGDDAGEECHAATFADSWCQQAWRWNLDYVEDPRGNAIAYYYNKETNSYGRNLKAADDTPYVRGGTLDRIEYGLKATAVFSTAALAKVDFSETERCIPDTQTTCSSIDADASYWYDTPWDLNCTAGTDCDQGRLSPAFFTRKRLTDVTTQVLQSGSFTNVDSWKLAHRWGMADTDYQLLLESVQHTGHTGPTATPATTLPKTTFAYTQLANRLDKTGDGYAPFIKDRLSTVADEYGGQIDVTYTTPVCDWAALPTPESNTTRCFPQYIGGSATDDPELQWFNKYVVASVTATDRTGGAPDQVTRYDYLGDAAWHFDDDDGLTKEKFKTWSQWRGYGHVRVQTGGQGGASAMKSQADTYFLRGMDGDRAAPSGGAKNVEVVLGAGEGDPITDHESAAGLAYKTVGYSDPGGKVLSKTVSRPWHHETAKKVRDWGTVTANFTGTAHARSWTSLDDGAGEQWRTTSAATTYDTVAGRATQIDDHGDDSLTTDDRCTRTTYATNSTDNVLTLPSRVEAVSKSCGATVSRPADVISDVRTAYDGGAYGAAPSKGNPTASALLKKYDGTTAVYVESGGTFDAYGRQVTSTDLTADVTVTAAGDLTRTARSDGRVTTTERTPATGFPTTTKVTTPPATIGDSATAQTSTTTHDVRRGLPLTQTDTNTKVTTFAYDALGRSTKVWLADRRTDLTPSFEFTYTVAEGKPVAVGTRTLGNDGVQSTSYALYDGFLRPRQTQEPGPNGGRLLADTFYDERGLTAKDFADYYATGAPATSLFKLDDALSVETQNHYTYDGLGRQTEARQIAGNGDGGTVLSVAKTIHGGDRTTVIPPVGGTATTTLTDARGQTTELRQHHTRSATAPYDTTTYGYTERGEPARMTGPAGDVWTFEYDLLGQLTKSVDPATGTTLRTYDDRGQLVKTDDARPDTPALWYGYDNLGRKTEVREGSSTAALRSKWVYDTISGAKGHLAESTRYAAGEAYTAKVGAYDRLYRPTRTTVTIPSVEGGLQGTYLSTTGYNVSGTIQGIGYPAAGALPATSVTYTYEDATLRPIAVSSFDGIKATTSYSLTGKPLQYELSNDSGKKTWATNTYEWGTQRLATSRVDREGIAGVDQHNTYRYDEAGNVLSVSDVSRDGTDTQCFTYDGLRRMTEAWTQSTTSCAAEPTGGMLGGPAPYWHSYTYDNAGNRLTETLHDTTGDAAKDTKRTYAYPGVGKPQPHTLTSVTTTGPTGTAMDTFGYDETGNTKTRTVGGDTQTLVWDAEGNLAKVTEPVEGGSDKVTEYLYDTEGNRLISRTPTETTLYLGGTEITLAKGSSTPKATRYYALGGGHQAVEVDDGSVSITLADHHGTAQLSVDTATQQLTQRRTLPFGGIRGTKPADWPGTKGFVGGTDDSESTGLQHLGAREYDPPTGRFLSVDPLLTPSDPQALNGYTYSNSNPLTYSDPDGLRCIHGAPGGGPDGICAGTPNDTDGSVGPGSNNCQRTDHCYGTAVQMIKKAKKNGTYGQKPVVIQPEGDSITIQGFYIPTQSELAATFPYYSERLDYQHNLQNWSKLGCSSGEMPQEFCAGVKKLGWFGYDPGPLEMLGVDVYIGCAQGSGSACRAVAVDAAISAAGVGVGKLGKAIFKGIKLSIKGGKKTSIGCLLEAAGGTLNSFKAGTLVLMADGSTKAIEDVEIGDSVLATDPETGKTAAKTVTAELVHHDKDLVDVVIGSEDGSTSTLHTTAHHPFWDETAHAWKTAESLTPGHELSTAAGKRAVLINTTHRAGTADMYNLTVADLHTYYVLAGATPVLVHNSNGCPTGRLSDPLPRGMNNKIASAYDDVKAGRIPSHDTYSGREHPWWAGSKEYRVPGRPETDRILEKELPNGVKVYGWTSTHYTKIQRFSAPHFPDSGWN
ncbi:polymorphic toxin-type HINT domain-containing protein [Streptomyces sp. NPDC007861]|uniref:polymorphic toxin-type HINT domain-containing protein n=1 Tax=Streptomyces sp. NPDC007861 TaxID=3154893 RepID=UPI0033CD724D